MDTSAISYRVADFLKQHPPFQAMEDGDLLQLAARGRVRFHEAHDYILWQGEPHKLHVFVIQQGTVTLFDDTGGHSVLRDVRGAGDILGVERFTGARSCVHSARSASDVVIYAFPASDFEDLVLKYPYARQFVEAYDTVTADSQRVKDAGNPDEVFLHDVVGHKVLARGESGMRICDLAQSLLTTGADAIAVVGADHRIQGVVTVDAVLAWVAAGAGHAEQPIGDLVRGVPPVVSPAASVIAAALAMGEVDADAVVITSDGSASGQIQALATPKDIARIFGDQPLAILREIRLAANTQELRDLNHRARALALRYLTHAGALEWLARFVSLTDVHIVKRLIALEAGDSRPACWCFCGAPGRGESLTRQAPELVVIAEDEGACGVLRHAWQRVSDDLTACDYMAPVGGVFDRVFHVAGKSEWQTRYTQWLRDPVGARADQARHLFDLRPVSGHVALWRDLESTVARAVAPDPLRLMANDCLDSLPPLTFFQGAVVEESGETATVFRLEQSALQPLVDVGRVFGMAARKVLGTSTLERFASARTLLPEHASIFREAAETLRILLWQQARIGIAQGTTGSELPPALLSRHDRHVLKSGFRSILRLVEFAGDMRWVAGL